MATSTAPPRQLRPSGTLEPAPATAAPTAPALPGRLVSLDAYRGFVMLLLLGEALRLCAVAAARPGSVLWAFLCHHQDHVEWVGGSLHDMIQPSFSLLVGVALPFSLASRTARGQSRRRMIVHALWRALVLVLLGIWLRSVGRPQTYFTFEDTLTQIGLGYVFLFLLALRPVRDQWLALGLILLGYWAAFAAYPLPPPGFDYAAVGVPPDWPHLLTGFAAHWNKNSNLAWAFDLWFLNLFPRERPFLFNGGGYATLSFIPTLGTMTLGLLAGGVLRSDRTPAARVRWLVAAGIIGIVTGWLLGVLGICPVVKRIWTPSFTLWSGGICFLLLAGFYQMIDVLGHRRWAFPLLVIGMNSIAAYCLHELFSRFVGEDLVRHLGDGMFGVFGDAYFPFLQGVMVVAVLWLALHWMWKRQIFLRI
jgi:heparan-alpha-glucosaminide N-acetyltransferase